MKKTHDEIVKKLVETEYEIKAYSKTNKIEKLAFLKGQYEILIWLLGDEYKCKN